MNIGPLKAPLCDKKGGGPTNAPTRKGIPT